MMLKLVGWLEILDGFGGLYAAYRYCATSSCEKKIGISVRGFVLFVLMMVCGAIGIAGVTAHNGEWEDGQLAHGIIATIAVMAFVFLTVNLVFLSLSNKIFGRTLDSPSLTSQQREDKKWTCVLLTTIAIEIVCCLTSIILVE